MNETTGGANCGEQSNIKNKGFMMLDELFKEHGWTLANNEFNSISYVKLGNEIDSFDIEIDNNNIYVCVPLKNSEYKYETLFTDYFTASEYVEMRFQDFISTEA
jgi:hypothetical protein